jgi:hypothetical protein
MASDVEPQEEQQAPQRRGEAAWKAHKDRISANNDAARKAGRAQRAAREQAEAAKRMAEERRLDEDLARAHEATRRD